MKKFFPILLVSFVFFASCQKPETYPIIPSIKYKEFLLKDTIDALDNHIKKGTLVFSFVDGDGDIGLTEQDTVAPYDSTYFYDLFIQGYYYQNGVAIADSPQVPLYYRIPYVEPQGQNKVYRCRQK